MAPRPAFIPEDVRGTDHIGPEDTFEGDYGRLLENAERRLNAADNEWRPWRDSNPYPKFASPSRGARCGARGSGTKAGPEALIIDLRELVRLEEVTLAVGALRVNVISSGADSSDAFHTHDVPQVLIHASNSRLVVGLEKVGHRVAGLASRSRDASSIDSSGIWPCAFFA